MCHFLPRHWMLGVFISAAVSAVVATDADASRRHIHRHHQPVSHRYLPNNWAADDVRPVAVPSRAGSVCAGAGRSFDCKIWPPPIDEDPDRKASSSDGG